LIKSLTYSFTTIAALLLMGCSDGGNEFTIEGEFDGMKTGELFIYSPTNPNASVDTLRIADSRFEYRQEIYDTIPYIILFPNAVEQVVFVGPGQTIEYSAATNDLKNYKVEGSEENELMTRFRKDVADVKESDVPNVAKQYIRDNPQSAVALYLFDRYFMQNSNPVFADVKQLVSVLRPHHPNNLLLYTAEEMLTNVGTLTEGKKLKNIELTTLKKGKKKLWGDADKTDYTLVVFWASWMRNSYDILYRMRNLQRDYGEQVRFVAISLDNQRYRWEDLVRRDSLVIEHYCDGLSWSSPVVADLALDALPLYMLLDKKHNITYKADDLDRIKDKLKKQLQ